MTSNPIDDPASQVKKHRSECGKSDAFEHNAEITLFSGLTHGSLQVLYGNIGRFVNGFTRKRIQITGSNLENRPAIQFNKTSAFRSRTNRYLIVPPFSIAASMRCLIDIARSS